MNDEEYESPYCEVCGTCGYIGCCGIRNFIEEHIKGKTNCKNEDLIISELIDLCDYKDEVFKQNQEKDKEIQRLNKIIDIKTTLMESYIIYLLSMRSSFQMKSLCNKKFAYGSLPKNL